MHQGLQDAGVYELAGDGVRVRYVPAAGRVAGELRYESASEVQAFKGEQIRSAATEIGSLVSVTIEALPDAFTRTLTLLVPEVHVSSTAEECSAVAIETTSRTSVAGSHQVIGAIQAFVVHQLRGSARAEEK